MGDGGWTMGMGDGDGVWGSQTLVGFGLGVMSLRWALSVLYTLGGAEVAGRQVGVAAESAQATDLKRRELRKRHSLHRLLIQGDLDRLCRADMSRSVLEIAFLVRAMNQIAADEFSSPSQAIPSVHARVPKEKATV